MNPYPAVTQVPAAGFSAQGLDGDAAIAAGAKAKAMKAPGMDGAAGHEQGVEFHRTPPAAIAAMTSRIVMAIIATT